MIRLASSSLPVPDSPSIKTVVCVSATLKASSIARRMPRCLTDDAFLAVAFVKRGAEVHDLRRQLIAFERRADLVGDAFDERDFVIFKSFARLAPNQTEQSKRLSADAHRSDERGAPAEHELKAS